MSAPLLQLSSVTKSFGAVRALKGLSCALGAGARIVIMDEPTASLTQKEQHLLFAIVRDLRQRGVGIIYITHRLEEIFAVADRVTVLRDGDSIGTNKIDEINELALIRMM